MFRFLSPHSVSPLSHSSLLSPLSWLSLHSQLLSVALGRSLFEFVLMHLARGLSSKLIIPPSVRPCVRPPPRGSSKPMLLHHTVWNFRKSPMYFTVLSSRRPQNGLSRTCRPAGRSADLQHHARHSLCGCQTKLQGNLLGGREAALAADLITAWKPLREHLAVERCVYCTWK